MQEKRKKERANAVNLVKARPSKNVFFKYYIIFYYFTESAHKNKPSSNE